MRKTCAAVIVAAGSATRMQGIDKMLVPLAGVPVVLRSVRALVASDCIDSLVIVTRTECMETLRTLCAEVPSRSRLWPAAQADRSPFLQDSRRCQRERNWPRSTTVRVRL